MFYAQVNHILEEYKKKLISIKTLCEKYKSDCVADVVVEQDIDDLTKVVEEESLESDEDIVEVQPQDIPEPKVVVPEPEIKLGIFSDAQKHFILFNQIKIPPDIMLMLEDTIGIINKINERFGDVIKLKNEMKAICNATREARRLFSRTGGSSSSRSKKRKQMKMKMKSSNYRSKTRNSKKKYKKCKSVKK